MIVKVVKGNEIAGPPAALHADTKIAARPSVLHDFLL